MYDLKVLFDNLDQFKKEASESSANGKKGNASAARRARALSGEIGKAMKEFRKQSNAGNV